MTRLAEQIRFIAEVDKLKGILRQTLVIAERRQENDAEHSWHLTLLAITLAEHANEPKLNLLRVLQMLIIHDLVEIDAGDTFAYDTARRVDQHEREARRTEFLECFRRNRARSFARGGTNLKRVKRPRQSSPPRSIDSNRCCSTVSPTELRGNDTA